MTNRMLKKTFIVFAIIFLLSSFFGGAHSELDEKNSSNSHLLYLKTPNIEDYIIIERNFNENLSSKSEYSIEIILKILKCDLSRPGPIFQLDLLDTNMDVKFSIRPTNDKGILFYYPGDSSLTVFKHENAWDFGELSKLEMNLSGNRMFFYVDEFLVGESQLDFQKTFEEIVLSRIRFGETDKRHSTFEGFITHIKVQRDNDNIFYEDFKNRLEGYEISKSESSILNIIDAEKYTTLSLEVDKRTIAANNLLGLRCNLQDSNGEGLPNKTISFLYITNEKKDAIGIEKTSRNGSISFQWNIPKHLNGQHLELYCEFLGDDEHFASESNHEDLFVEQERGFISFNQSIGLIVISSFTFFFIYGSKKYGLNRSSSFLFISSITIGFLFSIIMLGNAIEVEYYLVYIPKKVSVEIISTSIDKLIWAFSSILSLISISLPGGLRKRFSKKLIISYIVLFFSFTLFLLRYKYISEGLVLIASVLIIAFTVKNSKEFLGLRRIDTIMTFLIVASSFLFLIEFGSIFGWIYNVFDPHVPFDGSSRWYFSRIEANFSNVLYPISPYLLIILLLSWTWMPILRAFYKRHSSKHYTSKFFTKELTTDISKLIKWPILLVSATCALFLAYYPYLYNTKLIGVDVKWYLERLILMQDWNSALTVLKSFDSSSRWLYLLMLYFLKTITGQPAEFIVRIGPFLPASLLALSTYMVVRIGMKDSIVALASSFLAAFSISTLVGVFAGIYANWLAISWGMILFAVILQAPRTGLKFSIPFGFILSGLVLATHPWTWMFFMLILIIFTILTLGHSFLKLGSLRIEKDSITVLIILSLNTILAIFLFLLIPRSEFIKLSYSILNTISYEQLTAIITTLTVTIKLFVGGFFGNPILYLFAIFGTLMLQDLKRSFNRLILSILLATSTLSLLVGQFWQWRILYIIPFQILAALGYAFIVLVLKGSLPSNNNKSYRKNALKIFQVLLLTTLILSQFNYALRCMNFIIP